MRAGRCLQEIGGSACYCGDWRSDRIRRNSRLLRDIWKFDAIIVDLADSASFDDFILRIFPNPHRSDNKGPFSSSDAEKAVSSRGVIYFGLGVAGFTPRSGATW